MLIRLLQVVAYMPELALSEAKHKSRDQISKVFQLYLQNYLSHSLQINSMIFYHLLPTVQYRLHPSPTIPSYSIHLRFNNNNNNNITPKTGCRFRYQHSPKFHNHLSVCLQIRTVTHCNCSSMYIHAKQIRTFAIT
jgi:hypothetical protein